MKKPLSLIMFASALAMGACSSKPKEAPAEQPSGGTAAAPAATPAPTAAPADTGITDCSFPSFSLAYSEYASWSTFSVAEMATYFPLVVV